MKSCLKNLKKYLLNYYMDMVRTTLFRQTQFAEFEQIAHEKAESGEPLTKELLNEVRRDLQDNDSGQYSAEARAWALRVGLIAGNGTEIDGEPNCMWQDFLTREQLVTVLFRFAKIMGMA